MVIYAICLIVTLCVACTPLIVVGKDHDISYASFVDSEKPGIEILHASVFFVLKHKADITYLVASAVILCHKRRISRTPDGILPADEIILRHICIKESMPVVVCVADIVGLSECTPFCRRPVILIIQTHIIEMSRRAHINDRIAFKRRHLRRCAF